MTIVGKVQEWLKTQGYSLEMRAASAFRAVGFDVRQSNYYTDAGTGKPREIDVQAIKISPLGFVDVRFFVECKSGDKPWVLFSSPHTLQNYNRLMAFGALSYSARQAFLSSGMNHLLGKYAWFKKDDVMAAYSMRQAFTKEVDSAYAAAMNVANACNHHVSNKTNSSRLHCAFPVVVVDTPLFRCFLDKKGDLQLQEVEEGEFLFAGHELGTCIRVITLSHLPAFAQEAKQVSEMLTIDLHNEEQRMWDDLTKSKS